MFTIEKEWDRYTKQSLIKCIKDLLREGQALIDSAASDEWAQETAALDWCDSAMEAENLLRGL